MRMGLLSDTHDHTAAMFAGLMALQARGVDFILHCGDIGSESCIDLLVGIPSAFVWGNCDWDRANLGRYAQSVGVSCHGNFGDLVLADRKIALIHGDDEALKRRLLDANEHDYLFQGHTHVHADSRAGRTRVVNPGALFRASEKTVAVLNLSNDQLQFLHVEVPPLRR